MALHSNEAPLSGSLEDQLGGADSLPALLFLFLFFFFSRLLSEVLFFLLKWLSSFPRFQQTSCIFIAIWRIPTGLHNGALVVKTAHRGDGLGVNATRLTGCDLACTCVRACVRVSEARSCIFV